MTRNEEDRYWQALVDRDASVDGEVFYGVMTTGVYCRPSCPSRQPLRKNVRFYATPEQAERDGLRPCLRCHPLASVGLDPQAARISALCRYIEAHAEEPLKLEDLSRQSGLSSFHLQRSFKAILGVTPRQYLESCRMRNLKVGLKRGQDVTTAIYEAGFGSGSRVYEKADTRLGMTPAEYRKGGAGTAITYVAAETSIGLMMMGATDRGLCFVQFGESEEELAEQLAREYPQASRTAMKRPYPPQFDSWMAAIRRHLDGHEVRLDLPLDVQATAFQLKVWRYLQSIPSGSVESYQEVARGIGQPSAARAVARACATNRVAVVIPCHRVIRGTGELGGYRWGIERKRTLIDVERAGAARRQQRA